MGPWIILYCLGIQLFILGGCVKHQTVTESSIRENMKAVLVENWRIVRIGENEYPFNFTEEGPAGYRLVIEGEAREETVYVEDSKADFIPEKREITPRYLVWFMPLHYRGKRKDRSMYQRDGPSYYAHLVGKTRDVAVYLYYDGTTPPGELGQERLEKDLRRVFGIVD